MSVIEGLNETAYNKVVKHFLKKIYHVPVVSNRPLVVTRHDFIDFNHLEGMENDVVDELYNNYLENISKFCPLDVLVNAKMIDDCPATLAHYAQFKVHDFDDYIRDYLKINAEDVTRYLDSKLSKQKKRIRSSKRLLIDEKKPKKCSD